MKHDTLVRHPPGLLAGLVLVAASTIASAVTPQEVLEHAWKVLADKKAEVAGGKKELAKEARNLETAITNFTFWVDAVDNRGSWGLNGIAVVAAGINPDNIVTMSDMGIEISLDDEDRVLYGFREEAGKYVCFPSDPPEAYRFFVIGRVVTPDVMSALDGEGLFSSITRKEYLERRGRIKTANPVDNIDVDEEINVAEWNELLVDYAARLGLPIPGDGPAPELTQEPEPDPNAGRPAFHLVSVEGVDPSPVRRPLPRPPSAKPHATSSYPASDMEELAVLYTFWVKGGSRKQLTKANGLWNGDFSELGPEREEMARKALKYIEEHDTPDGSWPFDSAQFAPVKNSSNPMQAILQLYGCKAPPR